jgi:hypothetical protein
LSGSNHVYDTWHFIEHLVNLLIADVVFLNLHYGDVEYLPDATMNKNFKLSKKVLLKSNQFSQPQRRRFKGIAQKRRYLLYVSRWGLHQTSFKAPMLWFAAASQASMSASSWRLYEMRDPKYLNLQQKVT